jgi:monoamine oxidase
VRFAGAERSSRPTWMEGAVESGEVIADGIIAAAD